MALTAGLMKEQGSEPGSGSEVLARRAAGSRTVTVVASSLLHIRRLRELLRRRQTLIEHREELYMKLPEWAAEPLLLAGLTRAEVESLVSTLPSTERELGVDRVEQEIAQLDDEIDALECRLLSSRCRSFDEIEARLGLLIERLRETTVTDPEDVFYDRDEARTLGMLERLHRDCRSLLVLDRGAHDPLAATSCGTVISYSFTRRADATALRESPDPRASDVE